MKLRPLFLALATGSLVLLLIAASGLYWILAQSPLQLLRGGITSEPAAAIFVPKQSPVMASLLVNPDRLEAFRQVVASPTQRGRSRAQLNQLKKSLLARTGLNYRKDIRPWLGEEITLAVTSPDFDRNPENGIEPGYLLALQTTKPARAQEFVQTYFSRQARSGIWSLAFEQYQGVDVLSRVPLKSTAPRKADLAGAMVGDFVLFANHPKVLREAINSLQASNLSLKNASFYQEAVQTIQEPGVALAFVNLPYLARFLTDQEQLDTSTPQQLLTLAFGVDRQGFVAQTSLPGTDRNPNRKPSLKSTVGALDYIPATGVFTAAGADLKHLLGNISDVGEEGVKNSQVQLIEQGIASLQQRWGIDLTEDIFSWVEGEYALALLPNAKTQQFDWVFVAQKDEDAPIAHLDDLADLQGLSSGNLILEGQEITVWTKLQATAQVTAQANRVDAQVQGAHTSVGNYEVFTTSIPAMAQALQGVSNSLVQSKKFQSAIAPLPSVNDGYLYIDWQHTQPLLESQPALRVAELVGEPFLDYLQAFTLTSLGSEDGVSRATAFLQLRDNR